MPESFRHIVLVKLRALGDVLTTFPLLRALKATQPHSRLTVVTDETYAELFATHPGVDACWPHPAKAIHQGGWAAEWRGQLDMAKKIRQAGVDLYIDLYGTIRTALWGFLAKVPRRIGFALRGRKYFYTDRIVSRHAYVVDLNLQIAKLLGWQGHDRSLEFFLTPGDQAHARRHLLAQGWNQQAPLVVIAPGGGWPLKCWAPERYGELGRRLASKTGACVVLSGSPAEEERIRRCAAELKGHWIPAVGLQLRTLAAIIQKSQMFIGNDSGPKYFAEAFGVPTLICYGPTDFNNNNPVSRRCRVVFAPVFCRPCHAEVCRRPRRVCLDDLTVDHVYSAAVELWDSQHTRKTK